jgi:TRAP-type transport system periplasmic protein
VGQRLPPDHHQQQADRDRRGSHRPEDPRAREPDGDFGLQFSEVYSALQTKIVDAQENPLAIVETAKLYEVQKFCSRTNHSWDGYHFVFNGRSWNALPDDIKAIIERAFNEAGLKQREDLRKLNETLEANLTSKGMAFNATEPASFQAQLQKSGFYSDWKTKFGEATWAVLEESAGKSL